MSKQIKEFLNELFQQIQNNDTWQVYLLTNWNNIVGNLQTKVKLEKIYGDTLIISVYDSSWMQEMFLLSNTLINKINTQLGAPRIKNLRFKIAERTKTKPVRLASLAQGDRGSKKIILSSKELIALSKIEDPELNKVLKDFLIRCHKEK